MWPTTVMQQPGSRCASCVAQVQPQRKARIVRICVPQVERYFDKRRNHPRLRVFGLFGHLRREDFSHQDRLRTVTET